MRKPWHIIGIRGFCMAMRSSRLRVLAHRGEVIEGRIKIQYVNRFWCGLRLDRRAAVLNFLALVTSILTASALDSTKLRLEPKVRWTCVTSLCSIIRRTPPLSWSSTWMILSGFSSLDSVRQAPSSGTCSTKYQKLFRKLSPPPLALMRAFDRFAFISSLRVHSRLECGPHDSQQPHCHLCICISLGNSLILLHRLPGTRHRWIGRRRIYHCIRWLTIHCGPRGGQEILDVPPRQPHRG
jgi:hypothetical protein